MQRGPHERRAQRRGRGIAIIGSAIVLVASVLPWYTVGGGEGQLTALTYDALRGSGVLTFLAALAMIALSTLAAASPDSAVVVDRPIVFVVVFGVAIVGILLWLPTILGDPSGAAPTKAPGLWLAILGVAIMGIGVYEVARESGRR